MKDLKSIVQQQHVLSMKLRMLYGQVVWYQTTCCCNVQMPHRIWKKQQK
jgi:hypothetical protein